MSLKALWYLEGCKAMSACFIYMFADLQSHTDHNNSGAYFGLFHIFYFYTPHIQNVASFWGSRVVVSFNEKLKIYLCMHGSNDKFLVL